MPREIMRSEPNAKGSDSSHLSYYFSGRKDLIAFLLTEHLTAAAQVIKTVSETQPSPADPLRSGAAQTSWT
jgi:hypothetical protein